MDDKIGQSSLPNDVKLECQQIFLERWDDFCSDLHRADLALDTDTVRHELSWRGPQVSLVKDRSLLQTAVTTVALLGLPVPSIMRQ